MEAIFVTLTTSRSRARAQAGSTGPGPVAADQAEQPVNLPHLRPRQVGVQQPLGIDPDAVAVPACRLGQRGDITHRAGGLLRGQVGRVGHPPAGLLARMGLDQHAAVEQLDQG
jgi:hypothetical protein